MSRAHLFLSAARFFWDSFGSGLGFGVLLAGERLLGEVFPFSIGARSRGIGSHVVDAVLARLGDLREDSGQELEDIEGLALRMRSEGVVM